MIRFTVAGGEHRSHRRYRTVFSVLRLLLPTLILAACEAPLDLSGVVAESARPTHRSDLFQAAAHYQDSVVVVGAMGTIVQSVDGGNNWQNTTLPGRPYLVDVTNCADGSFFAIDKTDGLWSLEADGNWARHALPEMTEPQALACNTDNVIWVIGAFSTILHSSDTGESWESWSLDEDLYLTTIQFIDQQHGVVTGEFGTVLLTQDAGVTWQRADDLPDSFYPQSTYFADRSTGWVVGLSGTIWKTLDGGQSWEHMESGISTPLYGITGFGNTLVAVGDNSTILYSGTDSAVWAPLDDTIKFRTYLRGVIGLDDKRFIVAGGGGSLFAITIPDHGQLASQEMADE